MTKATEFVCSTSDCTGSLYWMIGRTLFLYFCWVHLYRVHRFAVLVKRNLQKKWHCLPFCWIINPAVDARGRERSVFQGWVCVYVYVCVCVCVCVCMCMCVCVYVSVCRLAGAVDSGSILHLRGFSQLLAKTIGGWHGVWKTSIWSYINWQH